MKTSKLALAGLRNGAVALGYIVCVAWIMTAMGRMSSDRAPLPDFVAIAGVLCLFVLSALIEASAILGQPILMFVQGEKSNAFKLLGFTVATMGLALLTMAFYLSF